MKVYVDDIRKAPEGWELARSISRAIRLLNTGHVKEISLDHDIQCKHVDCDVNCIEEDFKVVATYISQMHWPKAPVKIWVHSSNVEGGNRIADLLGLEYKKIFRRDLQESRDDSVEGKEANWPSDFAPVHGRESDG